ncbi:MAG: FKBP-type peptidyl-prolyl cis-trans isomerase [Chlamydiales bacterium]|nr:FKBP-type peptidyl-prolyl cis-trans isomerase [Chlamydiales bacterium]
MKHHSRKTLGIIIGCLVIIGAVLCIFLAGLTSRAAKDTPTTMTTDKSALQTTPSGLRYQVIKAAPKDAIKPKAGQKVFVQYTGWLSDNDQPGQKFDSSYDRSEPFVFVLGRNQVIKGWDESLADMKVGEKRRVIIPPALAYGKQAIGRIIPANSTLIFDIELENVQ